MLEANLFFRKSAFVIALMTLLVQSAHSQGSSAVAAQPSSPVAAPLPFVAANQSASQSGPSLDETLKFIVTTMNDPGKNQFTGDKDNPGMETFGAAIVGKCSIQWNFSQTVLGPGGWTDRTIVLLDLAKVDPLSVHTTVNDHGIFVSMSSLSGVLAIDSTFYHYDSKHPASKEEAHCDPADKLHPCTVYKSSRVGAFLSDDATAYRLVRAFRHAAQLCAPPDTGLF